MQGHARGKHYSEKESEKGISAKKGLKMNIKQLLCLLVLATSGNTLGSHGMPAQPPVPLVPVTEVATKHFQHGDMPMEHPTMKQMIEMDNKYMTHPDLTKKHMQMLQEAYNSGRNEPYMKIGTYMQPAMTAMGNHVNASKSDTLTAAAKAQGFK